MNFIGELLTRGKRITSRFGYRPGGHSGNAIYKAGKHRGIDLGGYGCGEAFAFPFPIIATAVRTSGMGTWGNTLCASPEVDPDHTILVSHLQSIGAKVGQRYDAWQEVAKIGGTTHTGIRYDCHPHIEVQTHDNNWTASTPWRGTPIDPETYNVTLEPKKTSDKFNAGDKIRNKLSGTSVNVRADYGITGKVVNSIGPREIAEVLAHDSNGIYNTGYFWWHVYNGWVAESLFEKVEPEVKPEVPTVEMPTELLDKLREVYELLKELFE